MYLQEILEKGEIKCAHIVDDAFDSLPAMPLAEAEVQGLLDALAEADLDAIGAALQLPQASEDQIRGALLDLESYQQLYRLRAELPATCASAHVLRSCPKNSSVASGNSSAVSSTKT